jgi:hypothetical protein
MSRPPLSKTKQKSITLAPVVSWASVTSINNTKRILTSLGNHLRKEDTLPDLAMADTVIERESSNCKKKKKINNTIIIFYLNFNKKNFQLLYIWCKNNNTSNNVIQLGN